MLSDLSLCIAKGQHVGFVGKTGSGKTTLIDILLGLLEPTAGKIYINDEEVGYAFERSENIKISYVPQFFSLIDDSIANNITFGKQVSDLSKMKETLEVVQLEGLLDYDSDLNLNTNVGEDGVRLSGGQRQRIGIAKALYNNPDFLVLDEATSAMDLVTEAKFVSELKKKYSDTTVLMVAHRLSSLKNCDLIFVMSEGRIMGSGTYNDLLQSSDIFRELSGL